MKHKRNTRYMRNILTGVPALMTRALAYCAALLFGSHTLLAAANTYDAAVETHLVGVHRTNDAAITTRHLLWKEGSSAGTGCALCGAGDLPLGPIDNVETSTGMRQFIPLLGLGDLTRKVVASEAIAVGEWVYTAASGKVQNEPGSATTVYRVGRALTAASNDGDIIEIQPCIPQLVKVVANGSTLGQTQAAMTGGAIVIVLGA